MTAIYDAQDRLVSYGATTYTYTQAGELRTRTDPATGTTTYTYDALGNLRSVALPTGTLVSYAVDGASRRIGRYVNGKFTQGFLYQGQLRPVAEVDASGAVLTRFVYAIGTNVPDYFVRGGATYQIVTDHLGSPRFVITLPTGAVVQELDTDAFGRLVLDTNPGFQPFGFAGGLGRCVHGSRPLRHERKTTTPQPAGGLPPIRFGLRVGTPIFMPTSPTIPSTGLT